MSPAGGTAYGFACRASGYRQGMANKSDSNQVSPDDVTATVREKHLDGRIEADRSGSLPTGAHTKAGKGAADDRSAPFEDSPVGAGRHGDDRDEDHPGEPTDTSGGPDPE